MRSLRVNKIAVCNCIRQKHTEKSSALSDEVHGMLRVDHAGEFGANRIYAGQMAVLGRTKSAALIKHMWEQEKEHKKIFEDLMVKHRVRPTALMPFWHIAGFALGAGSALLGEKSAMACTVAVEASIVEHYNDQLRKLATENPEKYGEIMDAIKKCRDDEQEHHDTGLEKGAEQAPLYKAMTAVIQLGCKAAIALSTKI
ncbi:5-demethoxyubiquinone hydroxylase, mitochondrial isoform X2 [Neocloeon triangulifer]|uniref:5-demethoxyubiquinone hydroxylase, mitochondrial isoform X2 n=1 Tax=Neocloeon triangulifer TaxID=2078957 RepID=UPI00286F3021|nr:5-demethoxyubiquinone hydroxylase, mitochondrial isoform X2 [Neocloeon triangulifer]